MLMGCLQPDGSLVIDSFYDNEPPLWKADIRDVATSPRDQGVLILGNDGTLRLLREVLPRPLPQLER